MRTTVWNLAAAVIGVLASHIIHVDCPRPDTTKAAVIGDLCVFSVNGAICTPDYLFNTVVTNGMYDATETNRNYVCIGHVGGHLESIHVELGEEGRNPPTVGPQLLDIIAKTATVPLRIEKSETRDGKVRWRKVDGDV